MSESYLKLKNLPKQDKDKKDKCDEKEKSGCCGGKQKPSGCGKQGCCKDKKDDNSK